MTEPAFRRPTLGNASFLGFLGRKRLFLSVDAKARFVFQPDYARLTTVRPQGDWEGWLAFFLECVAEAADDGVRVARAIHALLGTDRRRLAAHDRATVRALRLLGQLPANPMVTVRRVRGTHATPFPDVKGWRRGLRAGMVSLIPFMSAACLVFML
jgi:sugar phosphate isomerase/epimerase